MLNWPLPRGIYLCTRPADLRRSFDGLAQLVRSVAPRPVLAEVRPRCPVLARAWASRRPGGQPVPQAVRTALALAALLLAPKETSLIVSSQVHRPERQHRLIRPAADSRS
jgi:hypothetical protein